MAGDPDSEAKKKLIANPRAQALRVDTVPGGRSVVDANSDEPDQRFGMATSDVKETRDLKRLLAIAEESPTFRTMETALKKKKVAVDYVVGRLKPCSGGGKTEGPSSSLHIIISPDDVKPPYHVLDVFVHEWGHAYEENGGPDYQTFLNAVQKDLGIRQTPDSHGTPCVEKTESTLVPVSQ